MASDEAWRFAAERRVIGHAPTRTVALAAMVTALATAGPLTAQPARLRVGERWATTGSADSGQFASIHGMCEDRDGRIWVADGRLGVLQLLSPLGDPLGTRGRRGQGPGEFQVPGRIVALPDGSLAVHDEARASVELFDAAGRWVRRVQLTARVANPKGFAALPDGGWVLSGGIPGNPYAIHAFDPDGALRASWFPVPKTENPRAGMMVAGGPVAVVGDSGVLFARAAPHGVYRFRAPAAEAVVLAALRDFVPSIGDDFIQERGTGPNQVRSFQWYFPQSRAVFAVGAGRVLNVVTRFNDGESLWLLFGADGTLVAGTSVPVAYEPWALTGDGDVLASYRDPDSGEPFAGRLEVLLVSDSAGPPDRASVVLEPIIVTATETPLPVPRLRGYYERLGLKQGQFITREEIERRHPRELWRMLYGVSGLQVSPVNRTIVNTRVMTTSLGRRACSPAVYLDGSRIPSRTGENDAFDVLDMIPPDDVEGIEFFRGPAETPLQFSGLHALCGVIVVWTRSGG